MMKQTLKKISSALCFENLTIKFARVMKTARQIARKLLQPKETIYLILMIAITGIGAFAQEQSQSEPKPPTIPSLTGVEVTRVRNMKSNDPKAGINDRIEVTVSKLEDLIQHAKCVSAEDKPVDGCTPQKIVLFLEGREIKGLFPDSGAPQIKPDVSEGTLQFDLTRNKDSDPGKDNDKAWTDLLGAPGFSDGRFWERQTALSIGFQNGYPLPSKITSDSDKFRLIRVRFGWFVGCTILLIIVLGALWFLAWYTELLRTVGTPPNYDDTTGKIASVGSYRFFGLKRYEHKPYSLAQFQMAFWFSLVILAFLYIWLVNGASDTITASTLALIGIGAGTALAAVAIDFGKNHGDKTELGTLKAEAAALQPSVAALEQQLTLAKGATTPSDDVINQITKEIDEKKARLALMANRIPELEKSLKPKKSDWFLIDVLTDQGNGISFHRFQMFVWTLILGILFIYQVWFRLSMPEFDVTLLALLGISSGTYLGFKFPEK